jgi:hypothetical protein
MIEYCYSTLPAGVGMLMLDANPIERLSIGASPPPGSLGVCETWDENAIVGAVGVCEIARYGTHGVDNRT